MKKIGHKLLRLYSKNLKVLMAENSILPLNYILFFSYLPYEKIDEKNDKIDKITFTFQFNDIIIKLKNDPSLPHDTKFIICG